MFYIDMSGTSCFWFRSLPKKICCNFNIFYFDFVLFVILATPFFLIPYQNNERCCLTTSDSTFDEIAENQSNLLFRKYSKTISIDKFSPRNFSLFSIAYWLVLLWSFLVSDKIMTSNKEKQSIDIKISILLNIDYQ